MNNKITASIHFCFKGKNHAPSIEIEIDAHMLSAGCLPNLYPLIAKANGYDMYSYEYEMMQAEAIKFSHAEGLSANFIENDIFDQAAFENAWHNEKASQKLATIAKENLDIEALDKHPALQTALLAAYHLGLKNK